MQLVVVNKTLVATDVVQVTLGSADGSRLPLAYPGSHIVVMFGGLERRYSLTSTNIDHYQICVQRARPSRGGSVYLHDALACGQILRVEGPFNGFPVSAGTEHSVLLAGGIGVTPFFTMAQELQRRGASFEVHYAVRSRDRVLPTDRLGNRVAVYIDEEGTSVDLERVLASAPAGSTFYGCGPRGMLEAMRAAARNQGIPAVSVRMESFGAAQRANDEPIEVRLDTSGITIRVEPAQSILQAALDAGVWATYECNRGECGSCYVRVLEGAVDHRDVCLSSAQRATGMCPCVSWASSARLTLDL